MLKKWVSLAAVLVLLTLLAAPLVLAQQQDAGDQSEPAQGTVVATGVLEKPEITTYMYGTHAITDEASGTLYALRSENTDLDTYVGQKVTVYGTPVPGYQNGQVEGGPDLLNVVWVDEASSISSLGEGSGGTGFLQYGSSTG
jgi:hypothetical protein